MKEQVESRACGGSNRRQLPDAGSAAAPRSASRVRSVFARRRVLAQNSDKKGGREKSLHKYTRSASLAGLSRALQTLEKRRNYRRAQPAKTPQHDVPNSVLGAGSAGSGTMPASTVLALAA